ncbi:hypothetical protein DIPPA_10203 [Diplonema papillatum]|nr:hypothetical protein DIPPA_10203 [Diplonema papillatum]
MWLGDVPPKPPVQQRARALRNLSRQHLEGCGLGEDAATTMGLGACSPVAAPLKGLVLSSKHAVLERPAVAAILGTRPKIDFSRATSPAPPSPASDRQSPPEPDGATISDAEDALLVPPPKSLAPRRTAQGPAAAVAASLAAAAACVLDSESVGASAVATVALFAAAAAAGLAQAPPKAAVCAALDTVKYLPSDAPDIPIATTSSPVARVDMIDAFPSLSVPFQHPEAARVTAGTLTSPTQIAPPTQSQWVVDTSHADTS